MSRLSRDEREEGIVVDDPQDYKHMTGLWRGERAEQGLKGSIGSVEWDEKAGRKAIHGCALRVNKRVWIWKLIAAFAATILRRAFGRQVHTSHG